MFMIRMGQDSNLEFSHCKAVCFYHCTEQPAQEQTPGLPDACPRASSLGVASVRA